MEKGRTVIKDKNNYLHFNLTEELIDIQYQADNIKKLNKFCNENDIKFMYVQAPFKVMDNEQLPAGIEDYSNIVANNLKEELINNGIDYLDLREKMGQDSLTYDKLFYKTDHHWKIESGFWAYTKILNEINEKHKIFFENGDITTNTNSYNENIMKKSFVGSQGKRVSKFYTDIDDVKLYIPKFETSFKYLLFDSSGNLIKERNGAFYEALINTNDMESKDVYTSKYESFLETNNETHIINNISDNNKKVLFIKDSFARPVAGYMSTNAKEVRLLDLRQFSGSTYNYIKEYNPDIIIMLYNPSVIKEQKMFNFR